MTPLLLLQVLGDFLRPLGARAADLVPHGGRDQGREGGRNGVDSLRHGGVRRVSAAAEFPRPVTKSVLGAKTFPFLRN